MPGNDNKTKQDTHQRKSLFDRFLSNPSRDESYFSDLKTQWSKLDTPERTKFILGAVIGVILFLGALFLAYLALSALVGSF